MTTSGHSFLVAVFATALACQSHAPRPRAPEQASPGDQAQAHASEPHPSLPSKALTSASGGRPSGPFPAKPGGFTLGATMAQTAADCQLALGEFAPSKGGSDGYICTRLPANPFSDPASAWLGFCGVPEPSLCQVTLVVQHSSETSHNPVLEMFIQRYGQGKTVTDSTNPTKQAAAWFWYAHDSLVSFRLKYALVPWSWKDGSWAATMSLVTYSTRDALNKETARQSDIDHSY
jgi:hypothetical protein